VDGTDGDVERVGMGFLGEGSAGDECVGEDGGRVGDGESRECIDYGKAFGCGLGIAGGGFGRDESGGEEGVGGASMGPPFDGRGDVAGEYGVGVGRAVR
jgi:hypothetical protein